VQSQIFLHSPDTDHVVCVSGKEALSITAPGEGNALGLVGETGGLVQIEIGEALVELSNNTLGVQILLKRKNNKSQLRRFKKSPRYWETKLNLVEIDIPRCEWKSEFQRTTSSGWGRRQEH
tara:strand:- start:337 stop:699 length:363 start_codon:yes stop_codon:yes gene_type:complete